MKKGIVGRLGVLALVLTLVTASLLSGTLAKYTSAFSGTDTVSAAKFGFKATTGTVDYTKGTAAAIDIFKTTNLGANIAADRIAPGAEGTFDVVLDNTASEVKVNITSEVTATIGNNVNVKFAVGGTKPTTDAGYTVDKSGLAAALQSGIGNDPLNFGAGATKTVNVYWKWIDNDATDGTAGGVGGGAVETASITIKVTATQVQAPTV